MEQRMVLFDFYVSLLARLPLSTKITVPSDLPVAACSVLGELNRYTLPAELLPISGDGSATASAVLLSILNANARNRPTAHNFLLLSRAYERLAVQLQRPSPESPTSNNA